MKRLLGVVLAVAIGFAAREGLLMAGVGGLTARLVAIAVAVLVLVLVWRRRARA